MSKELLKGEERQEHAKRRMKVWTAYLGHALRHTGSNGSEYILMSYCYYITGI